MTSDPGDSQSSSSSNSSLGGTSRTIEPEHMMDWKEWENWMAKLQSRGLNYFLNRYVVTKKIDIEKFLTNLDFTISIIVNESLTDTSEEINKIQSLIKLERSIIKFLRVRKKLSQYNTIDDAVSLVQQSKNILILTGAGISTSCGIPDFRSENGLYSQLEDYDGLDDPYDMFDLKFFKSNPEPFYKFIKNIFPFSSSKNIQSPSLQSKSINPSDSHRFISLVESNSKLLRNYTQNIDTLETRAGVQKLIQCHGSFANFTCLKCKAKYPGSQFENLIAEAKVILCPLCSASAASQNSTNCQQTSKKRRKTNSGGELEFNDDRGDNDDDTEQDGIDWISQGLMKPDITFFGEDLPNEFDEAIEVDRFKCDLVIVIGTSLKVAPVSEIIKFVPNQVPQILINRDPIYGRKKSNSSGSSENSGSFEYIGDEFEFDIYLFGDSDVILRELSIRLGQNWQLSHPSTAGNDSKNQSDSSIHHHEDLPRSTFTQFNPNFNHIWLFTGSNSGHSWFDQWNNDHLLLRNSNEDGDSTSSESEPVIKQTEGSLPDLHQTHCIPEVLDHSDKCVEGSSKPEDIQN